MLSGNQSWVSWEWVMFNGGPSLLRGSGNANAPAGDGGKEDAEGLRLGHVIYLLPFHLSVPPSPSSPPDSTWRHLGRLPGFPSSLYAPKLNTSTSTSTSSSTEEGPPPPAQPSSLLPPPTSSRLNLLLFHLHLSCVLGIVSNYSTPVRIPPSRKGDAEGEPRMVPEPAAILNEYSSMAADVCCPVFFHSFGNDPQVYIQEFLPILHSTTRLCLCFNTRITTA